MSPIARALRRQTPAERLDAGTYISPFPAVTYHFAMLMLRIGLKLESGVVLARIKGGTC